MSYLTNLTDDEFIELNEKYFDTYVDWPTIFTLLLGTLFLVISILSAIVTNNFWTFVITFFIGIIICTIVYKISTLSISYKVLQIYYLKQIRKQLNATTIPVNAESNSTKENSCTNKQEISETSITE